MSETTRSRCLEPFFTTKGERVTGPWPAMVFVCGQRPAASRDESELGHGTNRGIIPESSHRRDGGQQRSNYEAVPAHPAVDDDPLLLTR